MPGFNNVVHGEFHLFVLAMKWFSFIPVGRDENVLDIDIQIELKDVSMEVIQVLYSIVYCIRTTFNLTVKHIKTVAHSIHSPLQKMSADYSHTNLGLQACGAILDWLAT